MKIDQNPNIMKIKAAVLLALAFVSMTVSAQKIAGSWNGKLDAGVQKLSLVFKFSQNAAGKDVCTMDCLEQGVEDFPVDVNYLSADSVSLSVAKLGASYVGALKAGEIKGKFSQMGMSLDLNLTAGGVKVVRTQNPQPPFPYSTEEVTFVNPSDGASLSGTLTYPVGYAGMQKRSVPVVLMVTGSGQENRDEEVFQHRPFLVIADYLARHGIATLRYDDRGIGGSKGDVAHLTTMVNMEDAAAGLSYLRKQNKFGMVGVLGHSEGGTIAFMLASRGKADFIVSMAGSAMLGDSVITQQEKVQCQLYGVPQSAVDAQIAQIRKTDNPWLKYFLSFDPSADIRGARCPVMAINGSKDMQVISSSNLSSIRRLLPVSSKNTTKEYEGLNHLFQHCSTGSPTEYVNISETVSPEVLNDIAEWVMQTCRK